jgi:Fe-S cluster assembly protein SufD
MAFTDGAVQELAALHGEPDWLRARRLAAFEVFERLGLPDTRTDEEWRRVDLKGLDLGAFRAFESPNGVPPSTALVGTAGTLRQRGTAPGQPELDPELARRGVILSSLVVAARDHPELVERHLFSQVKPELDKFAAAHAALFSGGTFLYVPDGVTIDRPLASQYWSSGAEATAFPHTLIVAGRGSRFTYMDEFLSSEPEARMLVSGSAEIFAGPGADIGYVALQRWGSQAWQFANQRVRLEEDSAVRVVNIGLGGRFAKLRLGVDLVGTGARAELKGLFFGSNRQFFDYHTLQEHVASHTTSDLLFKGALRDSAQSNYVGLIRVGPQARRVDAVQANRNLLLSDHAKAGSVPMLEIFNNDVVRCTHGATVGPVDPEHLFYLQSRGISRAMAQRMVVQGFLGVVLDRIPVPHARERVEQELSERIG